jgi:hypothetical protein
MNAEGGRLCVRFYKRADGTVLTKDCPVGWQALKKRISKTATAFVSLLFGLLGGLGLTTYFSRAENSSVMGDVSYGDEKFGGNYQTMGVLAYEPTPSPTMGNVAIDYNREVENYIVGKMQVKETKAPKKRR